MSIVVSEPRRELTRVEIAEKEFELAQREAKMYASSSLVPKDYQNNVANVMIAMNIAKRLKADLLMVMQNLYIVHGKPSWSTKFLVGTANMCGRFTPIQYERKHNESGLVIACRAYAHVVATGERLDGAWITWEMAVAEEWVARNGSKWKTMREHMFMNRAGTFWTRAYAPELSLGLLSSDEAEEMTIDAAPLASRTKLIDALEARRIANPAPTQPTADNNQALPVAEPVDIGELAEVTEDNEYDSIFAGCGTFEELSATLSRAKKSKMDEATEAEVMFAYRQRLEQLGAKK